jgi:hypothetical protein
MRDSLAQIQTAPAMTPGHLKALGARAWVEQRPQDPSSTVIEKPVLDNACCPICFPKREA